MLKGIIKRFDDLRRIAIPKEVLQVAIEGRYQEGMPVEILSESPGTITIREYKQNRQQLLTPAEIKCFNAYIKDARMDEAFGNTDWCNIYHKIVGDSESEYAREMMDRYDMYNMEG